jgi:glycine/D-amino acid oxidase-like deaminating enzyme
MASNSLPLSVAVVGAGIVGLSIALELQRRGHNVTVFDRDTPMNGCSSGNAGYLSEANIFPPAAPDMLKQLPKLMLDSDGPLVIKPTYAPRMMSWGWHALAAVKADIRSSITQTLADLTADAYEAIHDLAKHANASHLLSRDGGLVAFKTQQALEAKCASLPIFEAHGIAVDRLDRTAIHDAEPALAADIVGGLLFRNSGRCSNPRQLGLRYAEHLLGHGARLIQDGVEAVDPDAEGGVWVRSTFQSIRYDRVVVCAGFWSKALIQPYVSKIPLASERGYHLMLPIPGIRLRRPVVFGEPHFAATPMDDGMRLAGTAEFASADAPPNAERATMLLRLAQQYLVGLDGRDGQPWMGVRPSLPDGLPAVGVIPAHPSIQYAFGHAHNGLTLSAVTAQLVASQIEGVASHKHASSLDLHRFKEGLARAA